MTRWQNSAKCRGQDPDLWFPEGPTAELDAMEAKRICAGCPVRQQCLDMAMGRERGRNDREGIFGGLDGKQRRYLYRRTLQGTLGGHRPGQPTLLDTLCGSRADELLARYREVRSVKGIARDLGVNREAVRRAFARLRDQMELVA